MKQYFLQFYPAFAAKKQAEQQAAMMSGYGGHQYGMHTPAPMQQGLFRPPPGAPQHFAGQSLGQPPHMQMFPPPHHMQMPPPLFHMPQMGQPMGQPMGQFPQMPTMPYPNMMQQVGSVSDINSAQEIAFAGVSQDSMVFSSVMQDTQFLTTSTGIDVANPDIPQQVDSISSLVEGQI